MKFDSALFYLPPPLPSFPRQRALDSLLFSAISSSSSVLQLRQIHALLHRFGLHASSFLVAKLLRRLTDLGILPPNPYPSLVFSQVPSPNSFLWTAFIRSHSSTLPSASADADSPLSVYSLMRRQFPPPPPLTFTFSALLKSAQSLSDGIQIHAQTISIGGFDSDLFVLNTLTDMYIRSGHVIHARQVFDEMPVRDVLSWTSLIVAYSRNGDMNSAAGLFHCSPEKDVVSWTAMVSGYSQNSQPREALAVFKKMQEGGVAFDDILLVSVINACAQLGTCNYASWIRQVVDQAGIQLNVFVGSALIDMYGKCGLIDDAQQVFAEMSEKDVYSYSAMISGLAAHGRADEAIHLFEVMVRSTTVRPNRVTFVGVLTACSHAGFVEKGRCYFSLMMNEYRITPDPDHYTCMVDLLGRAGLVEEALKLVQTMPIESNGAVWGALLGACRIHVKPEIAKIASEHIFRLEPDSIGNYIVLSNIYASAGMLDEVSNIRKMIRGRGLRKNPASSWMESGDGVIHEFFAGDDLHPRSKEIKEVIEYLLQSLRLVGYVPVLSSIVYDMSDNEKERILKGHSEKLALGFGVLTTVVRGVIRIMKNIRICEDCHLVMKMASGAIERDIIVRDSLRFHHFKNGLCSCRDFW
ncbi:pentatricopeptide repeat-containing protein At5g44230 [Dendrobium catenatum]|uniref:Pentatricopeptide repeat-containing protein n=1 Tax=Dendrobium catenatum TaxID=906689 RepID=A0A2I0W1Q7_9ASPA|nr:pentatricopeptide repeat-containing protein At5g44230 [Dendrobium catenatum]PKU69595.1 Pentatricopeptide repeat-containing protein [Dendrobium catenatum]